MNNFCEECGNKLTQGDLFCDNCGAQISQIPEASVPGNNKDTDSLTFLFFQNRRSSLPSEYNGHHFGVILTNFQELNRKFGSTETERLKLLLKNYLDELKIQKKYYLVLDASNNVLKTARSGNWKQHVNLLRKGIQRIKKKLDKETNFVMLFGGDEIIPMPVFQNPVQSSGDNDVATDLPYSTLALSSPLDDADARNSKVPVGRIPTGINSTVNDIESLLNNTRAALLNFSTEKTFGLSANCWQEVSNVINSKIGREQLYISPGLTLGNVNEHYNSETNINYFNLHGSNSAPNWYGQKGADYPEAFSPSVIAQGKKNNIIGVEACYGARFIGLKKEESVLLSALGAKTVSFVGSSRIAYGPAAPPMNLADIAIHDYLLNMQKGLPAGDAFMKARTNAFNNSVGKDPMTSLLTLMEFNLFGDPVFFISEETKSIQVNSESLSKSLNTESLEELPGDDVVENIASKQKSDSVYDMVRQAVDAKQQEIIDLINKNVWERYPEFKDIKPKFANYSFEGKSFNQLAYSKQLQYFDKHLLVNTNQSGEITSEFESK